MKYDSASISSCLRRSISLTLPSPIQYKIVNKMIDHVHSLMAHDNVVRQLSAKALILVRRQTPLFHHPITGSLKIDCI